MNHRVSKVRTLASMACAGVTASLVLACGGDDTSSPMPPTSTSAVTSTHASTSAPTTNTTSAASTTSPSSVNSSNATTSAVSNSTSTASSASSTRSSSSTLDASVDGATNHDASTADSSEPDATASSGPDAASEVDSAPAPPTPPNLCALFDADFGVVPTGNVATDTSNRANAWSGMFAQDYATTAPNDCRVGKLFVLGSSDAVAAYLNTLTDWVQQLVGCPVVSDAGPLAYEPLIPQTVSADHQFTTSDLDLLSGSVVSTLDYLVAGQVMGNGSGELLTVDQLNSLYAELEYLQGQLSPTPVDSTQYTESNCPDAGGSN